MLKVQEIAPDFALTDQSGHVVRLSDVLKKSAAVIFFYPKDYTPGCTQQSCSFRDNYDAFAAHNAQIIGISADSFESHRGFAKTHNLPYPLLSDPEGMVAKLYGVNKMFGMLPGRVSFVIDKSGVIRCAISSQFNIQSHIDKTLEAVKGMSA